MRVIIKSHLSLPAEQVFKHFDEALFRHLLPPGSTLLQFDGCKTADVVHLKLPLNLEWKSEIIDHGQNEKEYFFIDKGVKLPFPLRKWTHKHIIRRNGPNSIIIDDMMYSSGFLLFDIILYPFLFAAFFPRKWGYKFLEKQK